MGITHSTSAGGSDSGDGKISKNAWNADHTGSNLTVVDGIGTSVSGVTSITLVGMRITDLGSGAVSLVPISSAGATALGTYGDECNTESLDAAWTLRNISSVTGNGSRYSILLDAQGDAMTRAFTDSGQDFELLAHLQNLSDAGGMIGIYAVDSNGTGIGLSRYNDGNTYLWNLTTWTYGSTGPSVGNTCVTADHWLHLRRVSNAWSARYSNDGNIWTAWSSTYNDSRTIAKVGIGRAYTGGGSQTLYLERFAYGSSSISFPW